MTAPVSASVSLAQAAVTAARNTSAHTPSFRLTGEHGIGSRGDPLSDAVELGARRAAEEAAVGVGRRAAVVDHPVHLAGDGHLDVVALGQLDRDPGGVDALGHHVHLAD